MHYCGLPLNIGFLLNQMLDLVEQGGSIAHWRLVQYLLGGGPCQLHQPGGDHAIECIQRMLKFGYQLLLVPGHRPPMRPYSRPC